MTEDPTYFELESGDTILIGWVKGPAGGDILITVHDLDSEDAGSAALTFAEGKELAKRIKSIISLAEGASHA